MTKLNKTINKPLRRLAKYDDNRLLLASLVIVVTAMLVVNTSYITKRMINDTNSVGTILSSNSKAVTPAFTASIKNVSENNWNDPAFTLADNQTMLIMNITIKNTSGQDQNFIPNSQLYIRTPDGQYQKMHPSMYVTNQIGAQTPLKAGQTATGQISFSVPAKADRLLLYVDTGWLNQTPVVFDVLH